MNAITARWASLAILLLTINGGNLMAIEEAKYSVIEQSGDIELRDYSPSIVAETTVEDDFEGAGNLAFRPLFKYISGDNEANDEIAMTSPVSQQKASEKIAMTAPVSQQASGEGWVVSFMMPASLTMRTIPKPSNPNVRIREVPAFRAAVIRFSGRWSEKNYHEHLQELQSWIAQRQLTVKGDPIWARYDPPFKPWFMRRNEILIPVS
jgi:effector-binding domain-containing protein